MNGQNNSLLNNTAAGLLLLLLAVPARAQVRGIVGAGGGVVYSNSTVSVIGGVEITAKRLEFNTLNTFSPFEAHTGLGTGVAGSVRESAILWTTKSIGITASFQGSEYDTVIHKRAYY